MSAFEDYHQDRTLRIFLISTKILNVPFMGQGYAAKLFWTVVFLQYFFNFALRLNLILNLNNFMKNGSCYPLVRFCMCCIVVFFLYTSVFLLFRCFPLIVDVFPSVLICNPDLFSFNRNIWLLNSGISCCLYLCRL